MKPVKYAVFDTKNHTIVYVLKSEYDTKLLKAEQRGRREALKEALHELEQLACSTRDYWRTARDIGKWLKAAIHATNKRRG